MHHARSDEIHLRGFIVRLYVGTEYGGEGEILFHCYARNAGKPSAKETGLTEIR